MTSLAKLAIGVLAIVLLTYGSFYLAGNGERTINTLTARANQALVDNNIIGVTVALEAHPLRRVAHLSGTMAPERQAQAMTIVSAVPGIGFAVWDRDGPAPATY